MVEIWRGDSTDQTIEKTNTVNPVRSFCVRREESYSSSLATALFSRVCRLHVRCMCSSERRSFEGRGGDPTLNLSIEAGGSVGSKGRRTCNLAPNTRERGYV